MGHYVGVVELRSSAPLAAIGCLIGALITIPAASAQAQFDSEPEPLRLETYGPVGPKETLWAAAKSLAPKSPGATTAQMAWALYRANPESFDGAPGKIRPGSNLKVPNLDYIKSVSNAEAHALLTGQRAAPAVTANPPPAPPPVAASRAAVTPVIAGVELLPAMGTETRQDFAIVGSGFQPGATLTFTEVDRKQVSAERKAARVSPTRIEYAALFGKQTARWTVAVRNPDGTVSAPYAFEGGANVMLVLDPPAVAAAPTVPAPAAMVPAPAVPFPVPMSADDLLAKFVLNPELAAAIQPAAVADAVPDFRNSRDAKSLPPGDAQARYRALESLEPRYAGNVDFDYQYGSSAYDSGHASEAVFILQRAVSLRPGFSGARMELARAYYTTGDNESSRREFETLKSENPPPDASRAIADYLKAIDRRAASYESQLLGYLEGSSGFDTNANGGPDTQTFLGITLDTRNQATESSYYGLAAGGLFSYPLAPGWRAVGDARLQHRAYPDATFVDSDLIRAGGGVEWKPGLFTLGLAPSLSSVRLDGQDNHRNTSVDASAAYAANERWQLSLNARLAQLRYVDALDQQDADSTLFGLGSQHTWAGAPRVQVTAALTTGQDDPKSATSQFGRDLLGSRTSASLDFGRGRVLSLAFSFLTSNFDGTFFGKQRDDQQLAATLGLDWGVYRATGWLLRGQLIYVDNSSTVALYDYDRLDAGLSLRKEFQ